MYSASELKLENDKPYGRSLNLALNLDFKV